MELRGVSKKFDEGDPAVDDVWLSLKRGELHSLVGPSGCGKTTLLRMIGGFESPSAGQLVLNGTPLNGRPPYERPVSTVFQNYALFPHMTVQGNIEFGLKRRGLGDRERRVREVLALVQLEGLESRFPSQISGGQRQRVALARSLALEPELLLLDEPLSALDPNLRKEVRAELKALQRRVGTTFLMVTHDQEEALSVSDRITVMNRGRVEQVGTPEEVYLKPRTRFAAAFLGAMNWIDGIGIRPEATRVSHQPPSNGARVRSAHVTASTFLGDCIQLEARLANGESLVAQVSRLNGVYRAGESVHVWWHAADEIVL